MNAVKMLKNWIYQTHEDDNMYYVNITKIMPKGFRQFIVPILLSDGWKQHTEEIIAKEINNILTSLIRTEDEFHYVLDRDIPKHLKENIKNKLLKAGYKHSSAISNDIRRSGFRLAIPQFERKMNKLNSKQDDVESEQKLDFDFDKWLTEHKYVEQKYEYVLMADINKTMFKPNIIEHLESLGFEYRSKINSVNVKKRGYKLLKH